MNLADRRDIIRSSQSKKRIMPTLNISISDKDDQFLNELAEATGRSKAELATEAITEYLEFQAWEMAEIQEAIAEADAGDLTPHEEVVKYWEKKYADSLDSNSKAKLVTA